MGRLTATAGAIAGSILVAAVVAHAAPRASQARVWVSNEDEGNVVAIDPDTGEVAPRIEVGRRPRGLALSPDGKLLYVTMTGSPKPPPPDPHGRVQPAAAADRAADAVAIVDVAAGKLVRTLSAGQAPIAIALSPDGKTAYVANGETAELTVLDLVAGQIKKKLAVGQEPSGVAVRADGKVVYVAAAGSNEVTAIDAARLQLAMRIDAGSRPRSVVFARDGARAFAIDEQIPQITFLDARKHTMDGNLLLVNQVKTTFEPQPYTGVLSPNGKLLYVSCGLGQSVLVVDVTSRKVVRAIDRVGALPRGIGVSRDGKRLFTANGPSNDVSIIDAASGKVEKRVPVGRAPWDLVVSPAASSR